ncbi:MAG: hypothetical protein V9F04_08390 [Dermatophilaceae bacterium]
MVKTAPPLNDVARRSTADTPLFSPWPWAIGSLAVALLLAMGEVARLVAMVPDREGSTLALTGPLTGPSTLTTWTLDPWHLLDRVTADPSAAAFVRSHVALDLIFIALYAVVLPRLPRSPLWQSILGAPSPAWARRLTMPGLLCAAAVADVVEDLGLLCVTSGGSIGLAPLVGIMGASKLKWLAVFAFIAWAVVTVRRSPVARAALRAWWSGLYRQRFSVMAIAPLALLSLVPAGDVLDQLPDVQRRWFTAPAGQTVPASDIKDMVVAVALVLVEAAALFWLGRMVSEDTARATGTPALRTERWWPWLFGPVIAAGGLCAYWGTGATCGPRRVRRGAPSRHRCLVVGHPTTAPSLPQPPRRRHRRGVCRHGCRRRRDRRRCISRGVPCAGPIHRGCRARQRHERGELRGDRGRDCARSRRRGVGRDVVRRSMVARSPQPLSSIQPASGRRTRAAGTGEVHRRPHDHGGGATADSRPAGQRLGDA